VSPIRLFSDIQEQYTALFAAVDEMKAELGRRRPLTSGESRRLQDEFFVEFMYNSTAIEGNTLTLQGKRPIKAVLTPCRQAANFKLEAVS